MTTRRSQVCRAGLLAPLVCAISKRVRGQSLVKVLESHSDPHLVGYTPD